MDGSHLKIVFAGSAGAGKTASINSVSDISSTSHEEISNDTATKKMLENSTVALDYGQIRLKDKTIVHLYGAPGQDSFDFMWNILSLEALGVVILINNNAKNPLADLDVYLNTFTEHLRNRSIVIGITNVDLARKPDINAYRNHISYLDQNIPVFTLDARDPDMVRILVKTLMYRKDIWLN